VSACPMTLPEGAPARRQMTPALVEARFRDACGAVAAIATSPRAVGTHRTKPMLTLCLQANLVVRQLPISQRFQPRKRPG